MSANPVVLKVSAVAVALVLVACAVFVNLPKNHGTDTHSVSEHTFYYYDSNDLKNPTSGTMYYSDDYFRHSSTEYDAHLATASLAVTIASNWETGFDYTASLMKELGFTDVSQIGTGDTTGATPAAVISMKTVDDFTVVCVSPRGSEFECDWTSNIDIGSSGDHAGFDEVSDVVLGYIKEYAATHNLSKNVKLWISGYSRAAAIANSVAGKICASASSGNVRDLVGFETTTSDVFAYCTSCPCTVYSEGKDVHGDVYKGIWNIINPADLVPTIVLPYLGMERYGTDVLLPTPGDDGYEEKEKNMLRFYDSLPNRGNMPGYDVDEFSPYGTQTWTSQSEFVKALGNELGKALGSRESYTRNIEPEIENALHELYMFTDVEHASEIVDRMLSDDPSALTKAALYVYVGDIEGAMNSLHDCFIKAVTGLGLSETGAESMFGSISKIAVSMRSFITSNMDTLMTFALNASAIMNVHFYMEQQFGWLMSQDTYYTTTS